MADILIPDIPEDAIAAIDMKAQRLGLSRADYLRRLLARERAAEPVPVSVADLTRLPRLAPTSTTQRSWTAPGDESTAKEAAYFLRTRARD